MGDNDGRGRMPAGARGYDGFRGVVAERTSQSTPAWDAPMRARAGAPNVVVVLVDDMGFADISPFGGETDTPALEELAADGYRFSGFRATPVCSPSRAALLTGANPHRAGFGMVAHVDPGYPGHRMLLPDTLPTLAESLRSGGYATFMVGKWHLTRETLMHDGADKSSWPVQRGFDHYFGSMDGFTTLFHPHRIVRDNTPVTEPFADDEYLTDRLTDEAIGMIDALRANEPDKPFFLYFAHHAVHGPVQAKPADIEKYRGRYDAGWDAVRRARFERQRSAGLFGPDAELSPSGPEHTLGVPAWDDVAPEDRALFARHMEVYAAAVDGVDQSLARLVAHLKQLGEYENTIIVFLSDNGGTGEGGVRGTRSYFSQFVQLAGLPEDWNADVDRPLDELGGPRVHGHYPRGWAHASNTPFRRYKAQVFEGGVHTPLLLSWPAGLPKSVEDAGIRRQFAYVTDLAPTLLDLAGVDRPATLRGRAVAEADGVSLRPVLRDAGAATPHDGQYLELAGQRALYSGRFKAVSPVLAQDAWQLYDIEADPAEVHDVAASHPDLVASMAAEWRRQAWHNTVFPQDDDFTLFTHRPASDLEFSRPVTIMPGTPTLERWRSQRLTGMRSFEIRIVLDGGLGEGVLVAHGDQGGGYLLAAVDGRLQLSYNAYGAMHRRLFDVPGDVTRIDVAFDALPDVAWAVRVRVAGRDGREWDAGGLDRVPMLVGMAPFTGISVGFDGGGPVDWELHAAHGTFPYRAGAGRAHTGPTGLRSVRFVPGPVAPYNPEVMVAIGDLSDRLLD